MKKLSVVANSSRLVWAIVVIALAHGTFLLVANSKVQSQGQDRASATGQGQVQGHNAGDESIVSKVKGFAVVGIERESGEVKVNLRNTYSRAITALCVESANVLTTVDRIGTEYSIAPGSTYVYVGRPAHPGEAITISAVVFDDGSGDGNLDHIKQIQDYRRGQAKQIRRIQPIFDDLIKLRTAVDPTGVPELRVTELLQRDRTDGSFGLTLAEAKAFAIERIRALPDNDTGASFQEMAGLRDAKELAISRIEEVETAFRQGNYSTFQAACAGITRLYDSRLRVLSESLSHARNH